MMLTDTEIVKFTERVAPPDLRDCQLWLAGRDGDGYGVMRVTGGTLAHRISYAIAYCGGDMARLPAVVEHVAHSICGNRHCVAPKHLRAGTQSTNMKQRKEDGVHDRKVVRGNAHGKAKLSEADIPIIRRRIAAGESHRAIAQSYGVTRTAIYSIHRGISWSHIP